MRHHLLARSGSFSKKKKEKKEKKKKTHVFYGVVISFIPKERESKQ